MPEQQRSSLLLEEDKVSWGDSVSCSYSHCMCVCCVLGDEEVDEQIRLRDDEIFQLKQQMAIQIQRIADLEHTVNELSQILKEEGMSIIPTIASACLFGVCMHNVCVCVCL